MILCKKKMATYIALAALVVFGALFGLALPSTALAWDDCPRGEECVYPGECSRYIDTNGDNICDHAQSEPAATTTTTAAATTTTTAETTSVDTSDADAAAATGSAAVAAEAAATTTTSIPPSGESADSIVVASTSTAADEAGTTGASSLAIATTAAADSGSPSFLTHYLVSPLALGFLLIYGVSFVLYKTKRMRVATHRKIWNVLLLATFLVTGLFGLILTIQLDYTLPFTIPVDLLFWHVEAGIVMTFISLFHMGWHFKYYRNLLRASRGKVRAARAAEASQAADERRLVLEAREQRRAEREAKRWAEHAAPREVARANTAPRPWIEPET